MPVQFNCVTPTSTSYIEDMCVFWQVESNRPVSKQNRRLLDRFDENRVNGNKVNQTKMSTTLLRCA